MSVPDPVSVNCETGKHPACAGQARNLLTDQADTCHCQCHKRHK